MGKASTQKVTSIEEALRKRLDPGALAVWHAVEDHRSAHAKDGNEVATVVARMTLDARLGELPQRDRRPWRGS